MMNTYGITEQASFCIDGEVAAYIWLMMDRKNNSLPEEISGLTPDEFYEMARAGSLPCDYCDVSSAPDDVEDFAFCASFDGTIETLFPERTEKPIDITVSEEYIAFIPCSKEPGLFKAAYSSPEELLEEFQEKLSDIPFPADFDWWKHIVSISGSYFC